MRVFPDRRNTLRWWWPFGSFVSNHRFGAPGVEFYGHKEKEINVSHLYFIPGQVRSPNRYPRPNKLLFSCSFKGPHYFALRRQFPGFVGNRSRKRPDTEMCAVAIAGGKVSVLMNLIQLCLNFFGPGPWLSRERANGSLPFLSPYPFVWFLLVFFDQVEEDLGLLRRIQRRELPDRHRERQHLRHGFADFWRDRLGHLLGRGHAKVSSTIKVRWVIELWSPHKVVVINRI